MSYDVAAVRAQFPALAEGAAHFDAPGGSLVPAPVGEAVAATLTAAIANRGSVTAAERRAEAVVRQARQAMADLLNADADGVIFGRSMTQLTYDAARTLAKSWAPGDEVVVSRLDHDANVRPWVQAAAATGARVRWADFDPETGELAADQVAGVLSERTRLVAVTAASNLIGTRPDIGAISDLAHEVGALLYVDGVHFAAHASVDVKQAGADLFVCSPYKILGPHCGVLTARPELLERLRPDKLLPSPERVPERFELGTLPYELLAGCTAAVDFIAGLASTRTGRAGKAAKPGKGEDRRASLVAAFEAIEEHENGLLRELEKGLADLPVTVYSRAAKRTPTVLFTVAGHEPGAVREFLGGRNINAPAGSFYAPEPARRLGLGEAGGVRVGLAPYVDSTDIARLLAALGDMIAQE